MSRSAAGEHEEKLTPPLSTTTTDRLDTSSTAADLKQSFYLTRLSQVTAAHEHAPPQQSLPTALDKHRADLAELADQCARVCEALQRAFAEALKVSTRVVRKEKFKGRSGGLHRLVPQLVASARGSKDAPSYAASLALYLLPLWLAHALLANARWGRCRCLRLVSRT